MTRALILPFLLAGLASAAFPNRHPAVPRFVNGRPAGGVLNTGYKAATGMEIEGAENFPWLQKFNFTNLIDHFNPNDTRTYQQRAWYNPKYTKNNSIIFLMIQGEGPADDHWAAHEGLTYLKLAAEHGADVFQLEHRFFGWSRPFDTMTTDNLKYLTTQQALEDVAAFIKAMNAQYNFVNPKWVTFGGSYPGALSAFFRQKYPDLTVGAVASSAGINMKLDVYEYAISVDETLKLTSKQFNNNCYDRVFKAFSMMQKLSLTELGRSHLSTKFNLQPAFDANTMKLDIDNFFANIYGVFQGVVQYTYDGRSNSTIYGGLGVKKLCEIMTDDKTNDDPVTRVNNVVAWTNGFYGVPANAPLPNSYSDMIKQFQSVNYDDPGLDQASNRGWMWLCCNQLGYLQTTDQGRNVFGQIVPLNYFIDMCSDMFNDASNTIDVTYIRDHNIAAKKVYGGGDGYRASNVVLPNGSLDPWHAQGSFHQDNATHQIPVFIQGTAHCADMYPAYAGEPADLARARGIIAQEVAYYLNTPPNGNITTTTVDPSKTTTTTVVPIGSTTTSTPTTTKAAAGVSLLAVIAAAFVF